MTRIQEGNFTSDPYRSILTPVFPSCSNKANGNISRRIICTQLLMLSCMLIWSVNARAVHFVDPNAHESYVCSWDQKKKPEEKKETNHSYRYSTTPVPVARVGWCTLFLSRSPTPPSPAARATHRHTPSVMHAALAINSLHHHVRTHHAMQHDIYMRTYWKARERGTCEHLVPLRLPMCHD
jgi:hypothetical protein